MSVLRRGVALAITVTLVAGCGVEHDSVAQRSSAPAPGASSSERRPLPPAERLGLSEGWGPDAAALDRAAREALRMPLGDLAGQVIVARWSGTAAPTRLVRSLHLGGVIAFADNVTSTSQIRRVNRVLRTGVQRPLIVTVDQEGGLVERIKGDLTRFPTFMSAGAAHSLRLTRRAYRGQARELRGLGFTLDLAPDADVTIGPADPTIGSRSAGDVPRAVAGQVVGAAAGMLHGGVVPVLKHFPGHGSVTADSHVTLPVQRRSLAELMRTDLVPFRQAVTAGLPAIMVGHLDVRAVDPGRPSSLSHRVITDVLRTRLGFRGLVMTDALDMEAVRRHHTPAQAAVAALRAGADALLMPADPAAARLGIIRAVRAGSLTRHRLQQAAARVLALLDLQRSLAGVPGRPGSAAQVSADLSARAITVVSGPCTGALVRGAQVPIGDPVAVANFRVAAAAAGLPLGTVDWVKPPRPDEPDRHAGRRAHKRYHRRLVAWRRTPRHPVFHGTPLALSGYGHPAWSSPVEVAVDRPYPLAQSGATSRIATFGTTPGAMTALVRVLLGRAPAPGRLPVTVAGVRRGC